MQKAQLDPMADVLVQAYLATAAHSRQFQDEYGQPPTLIANVHHMRSITQAMVNRSGRFTLREPYIEFGRVEITDGLNDHRYLLRSEAAVTIERNKRPKEALFDSTVYIVSEVVLLVYRFHKAGMDLSVAGTHHENGRLRLEASGIPTYIGTWPFSMGGPPFDQGQADPFEDLGQLDDFGEAGDLG